MVDLGRERHVRRPEGVVRRELDVEVEGAALVDAVGWPEELGLPKVDRNKRLNVIIFYDFYDFL